MCDLIQRDETALHKAAEYGYVEVVDHLIKSGADFNVGDNVSQ